MTFEEWWKEAMAGYKITKSGFFEDFGKIVAENAWEMGFREGHNLTSRSSRAANACPDCGTHIGNHQPYCSKYEP